MAQETNSKYLINGKQNILSGSAPSGDLTLGNFIGAIRQWGNLQNEYNCYYMVVDLHSITTRQDPKVLRERSISFFAQYLAAGLDPKKNTIFFQSHVSAHSELAWILNCFTPYGDLTRMTQFKDKSVKHPKNINAGLFTYPVLMAADILLYDCHLVPVGEDQKQHIELTRDIALRFNNEFGETFVVPEPFIPKVGGRVMALQEPSRKMDKSDPNQNNTVFLLDEPKVIEKKLKSATTDSGTTIEYTEEKPGVKNLLEIYSSLSEEKIDSIVQKFEGKMYGHLKVDLASLVVEKTQHIRDEYKRLIADKNFLHSVMKENAERASAHADKTLSRVYDKIGFVPKA
ncbi:MAG: tryptophan--tRNA ligase [Oligoflexia bacterium]|nr:tryptophan--tRNA ligase [Oligoflexia bacterium]